MTKESCEYQGVCSILKIDREKLFFRAKIDDCKQYQKFEESSEWRNFNMRYSMEMTGGRLVLRSASGHYHPKSVKKDHPRYMSKRKSKEELVPEETFECVISLVDLSCFYKNTFENGDLSIQN